MIRYTLLTLVIAAIVVYAWKDWFRALCVLIVMVAVLERPDMPKGMLGVQGLNPFNIGLLGILVAFSVDQRRRSLRWDAPAWFAVCLSLFTMVMTVGFLRLFIDPAGMISGGGTGNPVAYTRVGLMSDFFINSFKWMIPGLLLFVGCRTTKQHQWAVLSLACFYLILAYLTFKQMPLSYLLDGEALEQRAGRVLALRVGYHRVELAGVFAGASWAMLAMRPMFSSWLIRAGLLGGSALTMLALALTGGRVGYVAWCVIGLVAVGLRWRRALPLVPLAVALLITAAPGISERLMQGITVEKKGGALQSETADVYTITAGRSVLWPYVIQSISDNPIFGYGREAMNRIGLRQKVLMETGEDFGHPHNGYLQFTLDNGAIGTAVVLVLFLTLWFRSATLFRRADPLSTAAGGMAIAILTSFLVAAFGAQTFYPTESSIAVWCAIGLMMRASLHPLVTPAAAEAQFTTRMNIHRARWALAGTGHPVTSQAPVSKSPGLGRRYQHFVLRRRLAERRK